MKLPNLFSILSIMEEKSNMNKEITEKSTIRTIELFAGVGGFRLGLQRASNDYKIVWSNQWEPCTRTTFSSYNCS